METRYHALRTLQGVYRTLGWIFIVLGGLTLFGFLIAYVNAWGGQGGGIATNYLFGISLGIFILVFGITLLAIAEFISVIIDIEDNTRWTQKLLSRMEHRLVQNEKTVPSKEVTDQNG